MANTDPFLGSIGHPKRVAMRLLFQPQLVSVMRSDCSERPEQMLFERSEFICDSERRERSCEADAALNFWLLFFQEKSKK